MHESNNQIYTVMRRTPEHTVDSDKVNTIGSANGY